MVIKQKQLGLTHHPIINKYYIILPVLKYLLLYKIVSSKGKPPRPNGEGFGST